MDNDTYSFVWRIPFADWANTPHAVECDAPRPPMPCFAANDTIDHCYRMVADLADCCAKAMIEDRCGDWFEDNEITYTARQFRKVNIDWDDGEPMFIDIEIGFTNRGTAAHFKLRYGDEMRLMTRDEAEQMTKYERRCSGLE